MAFLRRKYYMDKVLFLFRCFHKFLHHGFYYDHEIPGHLKLAIERYDNLCLARVSLTYLSKYYRSIVHENVCPANLLFLSDVIYDKTNGLILGKTCKINVCKTHNIVKPAMHHCICF